MCIEAFFAALQKKMKVSYILHNMLIRPTISLKTVGTPQVFLHSQCWCARFGELTAIKQPRSEEAFGGSVLTTLYFCLRL